MIPTVVIGAGHAGLAASQKLSERSIDHVLLERGEVANTWRTERWDSLRLLTPNWQTQLPGLGYDGDDPDGFMTMPEVVDFISRYAGHISAPVREQTVVERLCRIEGGYRIVTDDGLWETETVVIASGGFNLPSLPAFASDLPADILPIHSLHYRNPGQLPSGGVLVVGASATGIQIADEVARSGRAVTIAVGEHVRLPRVYRGQDIQWWLDQIGRLDESYRDVDDLTRARRVASPQLVGSPERRTIDLNALTGLGARLVGRLGGVRDGVAFFSGSLANVCNLADLKQARLLDEIDEWADSEGVAAEHPPPERYEPTQVADDPPTSLDLGDQGIKTVIWATGYRSDYSWLDIPVLDRKGEIKHDGGVVTESPGLYRLGLNFLRRRKSSFIHGAEDDAADIVAHLSDHLGVDTFEKASIA